jgi:hypothetical protein
LYARKTATITIRVVTAPTIVGEAASDCIGLRPLIAGAFRSFF